MTKPRAMQNDATHWRRLRAFLRGAAGHGLGVAAALWVSAAPAELPTPLPHTLHVGLPLGFATTRDVDPSRSRRSAELPGADRARVLWQKQVPGGVSCNVLVDEDGRAFVAGQGRISQLASDGSLQFSVPAELFTPTSAALLADGTRALLTREGHISGWSPSGAVVFDRALNGPAPAASSTLLPLPDGGLLTSLGSWLFSLDASRGPPRYTSLPSAVQHTLLVERRSVAVDDRGRVFEWDGRDAARPMGAFSGPAGAVLADGRSLVAVVGRNIERMDAQSGEVRELARFEPPGVAPLLALPAPEQPVSIKLDGVWSSLPGGSVLSPAPRRPINDSLTRIDLLVDTGGTVAWWAAEVALHVETAPGVGRELSDVRCAAPISLVPAGPGRLIAACNSGAIWLVGPDAAPGVAAAGERSNHR
jgi:hypothetical protein